MRRKHQEYDYSMTLRDSLLTLSPITDVLPLSGGTEVDLICLSGSHQRSSLTFVKEILPYEHMKLKDMAGVKSIFSLRDIKQAPASLDVFILISL